MVKTLVERSLLVDLDTPTKIKPIELSVDGDYTLLFNAHRYVKTNDTDSEIYLCYKGLEIPLRKKESLLELEKNWVMQQDESLISKVIEYMVSAYTKSKVESYTPLQKKVLEIILDLIGKADKNDFICKDWAESILGKMESDWPYIEFYERDLQRADDASLLERLIASKTNYGYLSANKELYELDVQRADEIINSDDIYLKTSESVYSLKFADITLSDLEQEYKKAFAADLPAIILKYHREALEDKIRDVFSAANAVPEDIFNNKKWARVDVGFEQNDDGSYNVFKELIGPWAWKVPNHNPPYIVFPNPKKGINNTIKVAFNLYQQGSEVIVRGEETRKPIILGPKFKHPYISTAGYVCYGSVPVTSLAEALRQAVAVLHGGETDSKDKPPVYLNFTTHAEHFTDADWRTEEELGDIPHTDMGGKEIIAPSNTY